MEVYSMYFNKMDKVDRLQLLKTRSCSFLWFQLLVTMVDIFFYRVPCFSHHWNFPGMLSSRQYSLNWVHLSNIMFLLPRLRFSYAVCTVVYFFLVKAWIVALVGTPLEFQKDTEEVTSKRRSIYLTRKP